METYLLLGPEEGEKDEERKRIREDVLRRFPDAEETAYYVSDEKDSSIIDAILQPSLFSSHRLVTLKYFENASSALTKGIAGIIESGEGDVDLVILSNASTTPFSKKVDEKITFKKVFWEEFERDKKLWIRNRFAKNGKRATESAVDEVMYSVENNKWEMGNMIDLISSFYRDKNEITDEDINKVTTREKGENGYTLFKEIAGRNLENALMIVSSIDLQDPKGLIASSVVLTNQFRLLESFMTLRASNLDEKSAFKNAEGLSGTFPLKEIRFPSQGAMRTASRNYTLGDVRRIIPLLKKNESEVKTCDDPKALMEDLVWRIIRKNWEESVRSLFPDELEVELM